MHELIKMGYSLANLIWLLPGVSNALTPEADAELLLRHCSLQTPAAWWQSNVIKPFALWSKQ